jgi:hypothetical protein
MWQFVTLSCAAHFSMIVGNLSVRSFTPSNGGDSSSDVAAPSSSPSVGRPSEPSRAAPFQLRLELADACFRDQPFEPPGETD